MSLHTLLHPDSIAIIGASTKPGAVGNDVVKNIVSHHYGGRVYPVNPKADVLYRLPCFASIKDVPEIVDLAIIVIPAEGVLSVVEECGQIGIKQLIIISAGFRETGTAGIQKEEQLQELCKKYEITLLGPNCLGFINPSFSLNASFAKQMPNAGSIGFFSQSGALSTALLDMTKNSLSFSQFLSVGNKAALEEKDFLTYFNQEETTKVIGFYSEGLSDAHSFITTGNSLTKPTVVLKSGSTEAGSTASSSHTGSLAGSDRSYSALFKQARILRTETLQTFLDTLLITSKNTFPTGDKVAILTNAGGLGVLASDTVVTEGMQLTQFSETTENKLREVLPGAASSHNPVDVLGDAPMKRYEEALEIIAKDPSVDMLLVIITPQSMTEEKATAEALLRFRKQSSLPLAVVLAGKDSFEEAIRILAPEVALYQTAEAGAKALGALAQFARWSREDDSIPLASLLIEHEGAKNIIESALEEKKTHLLPIEVESVLSSYGFRFPKTITVTSLEDAIENAKLFHGPVVLKIISPDIIHKSDAGGVILNVSPDNIGAAYTTLRETIAKNVPNADIKGVSINEQIEEHKGKELILGIKTEPGLGKVILVGLGGIYVEVFQDVSVRFAPLARRDIEEMLSELQCKKLLEGARGDESVDFDALSDALLRLSQLALDFPQIESLDINPFLIFPKGRESLALDARISLTIKK